MMQKNLGHSTDTHMAKKYNDVLFDCMQRCNLAGFANESNPHYSSLLTYYASVNMFFNNTFMLFESVKIEDNLSLSEMLHQMMNSVKTNINNMEKEPRFRTKTYFQQTAIQCNEIHKMIAYGLQRRNMLVRESEREPRGKHVINYWKQKKTFAKGDLPK